jgi:uncharacterized protein (DUF1800 family)
MKNYFTLCFMLMVCLALAQPYTDYIGAGHNRDIIVTSSSSKEVDYGQYSLIASGDKTISGKGLEGRRSEAARFLSQCTFGYNQKEVTRVAELGIQNYLEEQFAMPLESYYDEAIEYRDLINQLYLSQGKDSSELAQFPNWTHWRFAFWNKAVNTDDQLRQRMAFALSQILVISDNTVEAGDALSGYFDILAKHAFGNYKDLLLEVALNPAMGNFLSHLNNPKEIPEENIHPDQNFAREIMQLFTIGLYKLNIDGSKQLDSDGKVIPTYNNEHISELARVFTGLSIGAVYPNMGNLYFGRHIYGANMRVPMIMYEEWHQQGPKNILDGVVIPQGQSGMKDIEDAIDALFNHQSCPPFVSKQLIQRFVTSNPSPQYVERVARIFVNDGQGVRGNLKAVIKAILLDEEARSCDAVLDVNGGKFLEPLIRQSQYFRNFGVSNKSEHFVNHSYWYGNLTHQAPLGAPSVFNFFSPNHQPTGSIADAGLVAPEFQVINSLSVIDYPNLIYGNIYWANNITDNWLEDDPYDSYSLIADLLPNTQDDEVLINTIDNHFTHGNMSNFTRSVIKEAIGKYPQSLNGYTEKLKLATYLTLISPDYVVTK